MTVRLAAIYRYPVKSLSGETLERVTLSPGETLPGDRRFALAHGSTQFDPTQPHYLTPSHFFTLKQEERLAQLTVRFDDKSGELTLERAGKQVARAKVTEPVGKVMIGQFFSGFLGPDGRGMPKLLEAAGHHFSDAPERLVSLINLASARDLKRVARRVIDPRRFRANLWIEGAAAWSEKQWIGREIGIGDVRLKVIEPIERCAATNVDPDTAERDMNLPLTLRRGYGQNEMGVYCEVLSGGDIAVGDELHVPNTAAGDRSGDLPF